MKKKGPQKQKKETHEKFVPLPYFYIIELVRLWDKIDDESLILDINGMPCDDRYLSASTHADYIIEAINHGELKYGVHGIPIEKWKSNTWPATPPKTSELTIRRKEWINWLEKYTPFGWQDMKERMFQESSKPKTSRLQQKTHPTLEQNLFNLIGALVVLYADHALEEPIRKKRDVNINAIIQDLVRKFGQTPGLSKSTLQTKLSQAIDAIFENSPKLTHSDRNVSDENFD